MRLDPGKIILESLAFPELRMQPCDSGEDPFDVVERNIVLIARESRTPSGDVFHRQDVSSGGLVEVPSQRERRFQREFGTNAIVEIDLVGEQPGQIAKPRIRSLDARIERQL